MYQLTAASFILRTSDGAQIPPDIRNTDYAVYVAWVNAGNTATPYSAPPAGVPQVVSRFQARAALHLAGLLTAVQTAMDDPATPMLSRLAWQDAQEFRRTSPTVEAMAAVLSLDDAALDALFVAAAEIEA